MRKIFTFLLVLSALTTFANGRNDKSVVLHHGGSGNGHELIYIDSTQDVENGATFAVKTPGKVTIDGCVFQSGAKVKIESGTVEIVGKFTAELGSMVEFKQFVD